MKSQIDTLELKPYDYTNPNKDIYTFNEEVSALTLFDNITLRFSQIEALITIVSDEETEI